MASLNKVFLMGRLGRAPEMKNAGTNQAYCKFSVATDEGRKDNRETAWHNVTVFGRTADLCTQYLGKGSQALIEGRIQYRKYTGKDGVERQSTDIIADKVTFLDSRNAAPAEEEPMEPKMPATAPLFKQQTTVQEMDDLPF